MLSWPTCRYIGQRDRQRDAAHGDAHSPGAGRQPARRETPAAAGRPGQDPGGHQDGGGPGEGQAARLNTTAGSMQGCQLFQS